MSYKTDDKKLIFFDLDGTLINHKVGIAKQIEEVLKQVKLNGHQLFIASGRAAGNLPEEIECIDWDGYVLGSGVYCEYKGKVVSDEHLNLNDVRSFIDYTESDTDTSVVIENEIGTYVTSDSMVVLHEKLESWDGFSKNNVKEIESNYTIVEDLRSVSPVTKMMFFSRKRIANEITNEFKDIFDFVPNSVVSGNDKCDGEILKRGVTKATGIENIVKLAGMTMEDTIVFGDGYNDMEMIETVNMGIAMGNAVDALKEVADMVTDTQDEDGIVKALTLLGLV
ncbi:MAG: HAD family hydrolase [Suipraeoptans sp.]